MQAKTQDLIFSSPNTPMSERIELEQVIADLRRDPPQISSKWFYDELGSALFHAITRLPEYYPTDCEFELLDRKDHPAWKKISEPCAVLELGSGSAEKISKLLKHLPNVRAYHPLDVSPTALESTRRALQQRFAKLPIEPIEGDFCDLGALTEMVTQLERKGPVLIFFPGSTLGNFEPEFARELLFAMAKNARRPRQLLIGVDLVKATEILERAYNDSVGLTASFNKNILAHLNRRFGFNFDPEQWEHSARYVEAEARIEMWLQCRTAQTVIVGEQSIPFHPGAEIWTESSYKFDRPSMEAMARQTNWSLQNWTTDTQNYFGHALLTCFPNR